MISIAATGGQSATAGMLPPSDSDSDEEGKPAPKPKGQVSQQENLVFMRRDHPAFDCRLACERDRHLMGQQLLRSSFQILGSSRDISFEPRCSV